MALIVAARERRAGETRAALTPEVVRKLLAAGHQVGVETGIGEGAAISDGDYEAAGAKIYGDLAGFLSGADILLAVRRAEPEAISALRKGAMVVGLLEPHAERAGLEAMAKRGLVAFAMELIPRITRAQAMDALSSQANLAGYRAVIEAAAAYGRSFPMMMTAAGTIAPAKVFVMGAGVAGLQAIATARRLGAVVTATDVRPAAKEQVESLGGRFVAVEDEEFKAAETAAGYAKPMSPEYQAKQAALVADHILKQDIVITTALIPGRPAPRLLTAAHVASMRRGSVIIDLAAPQGGNVEGSRADEIVDESGVRILGFSNLPGRIAADASALYARNLLAFLQLLFDKEGAFAPDFEDEILKTALVAKDGGLIHTPL
ncbi:MAG: Re/Si-specific NAD(P)(+) transhydrogenase subunit alpha, partial [Caulobacteraceae bacterium]